MESRAEPLLKQIEQFHGYLGTELARGAVQLEQIVKTLDAYTDTVPMGQSSSAGTPPAPATTPTDAAATSPGGAA